MPSSGRFDDLWEFVQIAARDRVVGHVIEDVGEGGEGGSIVVMPPEDLIDDGRQGTDAGCSTFRGLLGQRVERGGAIASLAHRFVVALPGTGQELRRELILVGQVLAELSTMEIQLVA